MYSTSICKFLEQSILRVLVIFGKLIFILNEAKYSELLFIESVDYKRYYLFLPLMLKNTQLIHLEIYKFKIYFDTLNSLLVFVKQYIPG